MKRFIFFLLLFIGFIGCSSNKEIIIGQWRFVGSDSKSQQQWANAVPEISFNDDQTFSWKTTDTNGNLQTVEGQYKLQMRYNVYMKSESESPGWNWEKGSKEKIIISGSTLKFVLNDDLSQFLLFQKSNEIDVPLANNNPQNQSAPPANASVSPQTTSSAPVKTPSQNASTVPSTQSQTSKNENATITPPKPNVPKSSTSQPLQTNQKTIQNAQTPSATSLKTSNNPSQQNKTETVMPEQTDSSEISQTNSAQQVQSFASDQNIPSPNATDQMKKKAEKELSLENSIDLLAQIVPSKDFVNGYWRKIGQEIIVPPTRLACLAFPNEFPESYTLVINLKRLTGESPFYIGLIVNQRPVVLKLNDQLPLTKNGKKEKSGFVLQQGKNLAKSKIDFTEEIFDENQTASIECVVEKNIIEVKINDQKVIDWSGNVEDFDFDSDLWNKIPPNRGFIATDGFSDFKIDKIVVSPTK